MLPGPKLWTLAFFYNFLILWRVLLFGVLPGGGELPDRGSPWGRSLLCPHRSGGQPTQGRRVQRHCHLQHIWVFENVWQNLRNFYKIIKRGNFFFTFPPRIRKKIAFSKNRKLNERTKLSSICATKENIRTVGTIQWLSQTFAKYSTKNLSPRNFFNFSLK